MTDSEISALRDVLVWAAGRWEIPAPDSSQVDADLLIDLLDRHRLDARFLVAIARNVHGIEPAVVEAVRERYRSVCARVARQIREAEELAAAARSDDPSNGLVVLKGFTLFGLSGDQDVLRRSKDIDVVARDPDGFIVSAERLGYRARGARGRTAEYAVLEHEENCLVEVHTSFPVVCVDAELSAFDPARNRGTWHHTNGFRVRGLGYEDLLPLRGTPAVAGIDRATILGPEAALLIQACHIYKSYILYVNPCPYATVRLDELAAIVDFCNLPSFRPAVLASLIDRLYAQDVFALVRALCVRLLARDPLGAYTELFGPPEEPISYPRDLWWNEVDGFPVLLPWEPEELVARDRDMMSIVAGVGFDEFNVVIDGPAVDLMRPKRAIVRGDSGFEIQGTVRATSSMLEFELDLPKSSIVQRGTVAVHFGDQRYEMHYEALGNSVTFHDYSSRKVDAAPVLAKAFPRGGSDRYILQIPRERVCGATGSNVSMPMLICGRRRALPRGPMQDGVVLPVVMNLRDPE